MAIQATGSNGSTFYATTSKAEYDAAIAAGAIGGGFYSNDLGNGSGRGIYTIPPPLPTGSVPPPPPPAAPAHLMFSANVVGSMLFLTYGTCRLPGQVIWAPGIDASNDALETSLLTFAAAYCEPIDPSEPLYIASMSANGTLFYSADSGPVSTANVLTVANISSEVQAQLVATVQTMAVYYGTESQTPDPTMEEALGAGNVPAYRGLRYIVFQDFPLAISNNTVPNIIVEWRRSDTTLVNVSTAMTKLIEHVNFRSQYLQARADNVLNTPIVSGISDLCYGLTVTSQETLLDHFTAHRNIYGYQIKEDDPIKIVRRAVGGSLVIDMEVDEADLIQDGASSVMQVNRANPAEFPVGMNLSYSDPDHGFDVKVAPAVYDGSQPGRSTATSSSILTAQSQYIVDATTARSLAYQSIFELRSYSSRHLLVMDGIEAEVGDTIAITTTEGDLYVVLVESQTINKNRANAISAMQLLTQAGTDIDGDGGNDPGSLSRIYWPEACVQYDLIPTESRIWSAYTATDCFVDYNTNPPGRRISSTKRARYSDDPFNTDAPVARMFEDNTYVYWLSNLEASIFRCPKDAGALSPELEQLTIANFATTYSGNSASLLQQVSVLHDGKLYIAWDGTNGEGANRKLLIEIDVVSWSPSAYTVYQWAPNADAFNAVGLAVTDNGTVVIAGQGGATGRLYYSSVGALGSWSNTALAINVSIGTSRGNFAYFTQKNGSGVANRVTRIVVADCTAGLSASVVDISAFDPNIVCLSQRVTPGPFIFCSSSHLFVPCNYTSNNSTDPTEREYLARLDLETLADAGGRYIGELIYADHELIVYDGRYFDGQLYLVMLAENYDGRVVIVDEDLSPASATLYPVPSYSEPENNDFADAINIYVGETKSGNLFYASMETGEPTPAWATTGSYEQIRNAGHSVWYSFVAPATQSYTISVTDPDNFGRHSIEVYTGSTVATLTDVDSAPPANASGPTTCTFSATAGTTYMISIRHDRTGGSFGFTANTSPSTGPVLERKGNYTISIS